MKRIYLCFIILLSFNLYGNDNPFLLSIDSLSDDVYYDLEGSWKFDLSAGVQGDPSTLAENTIFEMTPDLTASIWLFNKFFFETEIKELTLDNLFLFGYQSSDYGIQEVRLGNSELNIEEYAGYKPSSSPLNTPGARIKYVTRDSTQEVLVRYTKETSDTVKFIGNKLVNDTSFKLNSYDIGHFFILPQSVSDFKLYTYNDDKLSQLDRKDYIFYQNKNMLYVLEDYNNLYIESNITKSQLHEFTKDIPFIDSDQDNLWNDYYTEIGSKELLKLYVPGTFSTFTFNGAYELDEEAVENNSLNIFGEKDINYEILNNFLVLYNSSLSSNNIKIRYPFIDENQNMYNIGGTGLNITNELVFRELTSSENYYIDENIRDNSLTVRINGIIYSDYSFDPESGVLTINRKITQFDEIEVSYKKDSDPGIGNLLGVYGGSFNLLDNLNLQLSNRVNWDFSTEEYTTEAYESIGNIESIGELTYTSDKIKAGLKSSITISNPDTTNGMELLSYSKRKSIISSEQLTSKSTLPDLNQIPLINRDSNEMILSDTELDMLSPTGLADPYFVNHEIGNSVNKSVVVETDSIPEGRFSSAKLNFNSLEKDFSWAKSFKLSYFVGSDRDIKIELGSFSKIITLNGGSSYSDFTIDFTSFERQQLQYVDHMSIIINDGNPIRIYIKDITFEGDRIWSNNSTVSVKTSVTSNKLVASNYSPGDIELETEINNSSWNNYRELSFNIKNENLIDSDSSVEITILNSNGFNRRYTYSGDKFQDGNSTIKIDLENDSYTKISNIKDKSVFNIKIANAKVGSVTLGAIYLKDPIYEISNDNSAYLELKPQLSFKVLDIPILEASKLYLEGNYNTIKNSYKGNLDGVLLAGGFSLGGAGSDNDLSEIYYSYKFPYNSPVYLEDSFIFSTSTSRENSFVIETTPFNLNAKMTGIKSNQTLIKNNTVETSIKSPVNFSVKGGISQEQNSNGEPGINDLVPSYNYLILEDETFIKNNFNGSTDISCSLGLYKLSIGYEGNFLQKWDNLYENNSNYLFSLSNTFDFAPLEFNLNHSSFYSYSLPDSQNSSLSQGFNQYIDIFTETNPYENSSFMDLFYTDEYNDFFDDSNKKSMENITGVTVTNKTFPQSHLNIIVPETLYFEMAKKYSLEGDLPVVDMNHKADLGLTKSSILKNKFIFEYKKNILNSENVNSFTVESLFSNTINSNILDVSNNFKLSEIGYTNVTRADYNWRGKSGPLYIVPLINFLMDSPYSYTHTERVYLKLENSTYRVGLRHETKLEVTDTNETEAYIDIGYENESSTPFSFGLGIYTTLIF